MAKNIETTLTLNTRQFDTAIKSSENQVTKFGQTGTAGFAKVAAGVTALIGAAKGLSSVVKVGANFQDLQDSLNAVFGSAAKGAQAFDRIKKFSLETQFGVDTLTNAFIQLKGAGVEPTEELLMTFADTASVTTDQMGTFQAALDLVSRSTAGGLGLEDLNRLADRGIPVFQILSEQLGITRLEVSEFGKTTEGANRIIEALTDGLNERFGGTLQTKLDNVSVKFSNMQIAIQNLAAAIFEKLEPAISASLDKLTGMATAAEQFVSEAESIDEVLGRINTALEPFHNFMTLLLNVIGGIVALRIAKVFLTFATAIATATTSLRNLLRHGMNPFSKGLSALTRFIRGTFLVAIGAMIFDFLRTIRVVDQLGFDLKTKLVVAAKVMVNNLLGSFLGLFRSITSGAKTFIDEMIEIFTGDGFDGSNVGKAFADGFNSGFEDGAVFKIPEIVKEALDEAGILGGLPDDFFGFTDMEFINEDQLAKVTTASTVIEESSDKIVESLGAIAQEIQDNFLKTLESANKALSNDLADSLLEGKSALEGFKTFFKSVVKQLIADAIRLFFVEQILSSIFGFFAPTKKLVFTGGKATIEPRANGGPVMKNRPYIVGERGPELFVPGQSGGIVPNSGMGGSTTVNYNINAVDAPSFQALVASDPEFIYSVTRAGARRLPGAT